MRWCSFCDAEASARIERSKAYLCEACREVYEAGQTNPDGAVTTLEE